MERLHNNFIRSMFICMLCCIAYGIIICNLYFIQIQQNNFFKDLAEKQYNVTMQIFPQRAYIYDRNNTIVALNKDSFSAFILPKTLHQQEQTLHFLKKYFPQAHDRFQDYKNKNFMFIKRNLSAADLEIIKNNANPDINLLKESNRFYPYESLATILGITDIDNHGQFGLELQYNQKLQGKPTTFKLKKDAKAHHFYFSKEISEQGINGTPLTITIDANVQHNIEKILRDAVQFYGATEGAALILDPQTGDIIASVSYPTFDPNNIKELCMEHTKARPITNCFEFGSVIKTFAALTALGQGVTTLDEEIDCENTKETYIDHLRVRTVYPNGKINFLQVMQNSNNIGVVKVMKRVGADLYDYYKMFGFGQTTGLHFPGEQKGFINHPSNWSAYSIQSLSYGYEITTTLLQLARAFSIIVNDGYLVTPKLIKDQPTELVGPFLSQKTIKDVKELLTAIVQEHGALQAKIQGYTTYGKTGTAHILEDGKYNENRHLYSFVGALEKDNYKRVIACYLKDSSKKTYASYVTAPLFKKLAEALILSDNI